MESGTQEKIVGQPDEEKASRSTPPSQQRSQSEAEVEEMVAAKQARRRQQEDGDDDGDDRTPQQIARVAAQGGKVSPEEVGDALEVFLAAEGDELEVKPHEMKLNLGTTDKPKFIRWSVVPVDDEVIVAIRKRSQKGNRGQKRRGEAEIDENLVARRIVVTGTVDPDPADLAEKLNMVDPADALLAYFRKFGKTGLILQISGSILNISGYDEDDVSELDAASG